MQAAEMDLLRHLCGNGGKSSSDAFCDDDVAQGKQHVAFQ